MADSIRTPKFRVSFPHVFVPQDQKKDDGSVKKEYSCVMLFDKDADLSALKAAAQAVATEKWGDKIPSNLRSPFKNQGDKDYEGYEDGAVFIEARTTTRPAVVGMEQVEIDGQMRFKPLDETEFYPGCYAWATVNAYAYGGAGTKYSPGIGFGLRNIQKLEDGEPLGGRTRPEDDFAPANTGGVAAGGEAKPAGSLFD